MGRELALGVSIVLLLLATFCRATTTSVTKTPIQDDGFNLEDAVIDDGDDPRKPAPPQPKPGVHDNNGDIGLDFGDAIIGDGDDSRKPAPSPPRPKPGGHDNTGDIGLDLGDAIIGDGDDSRKPAPPRPKPGSHGNTGEFSDSDLFDGELPPDKPRSGGHDPQATEGSQGMLAGIVSSVVVAIVGAVSSFIAYQKKKLCFKAGDQENVHMESQQGIHAEPPVQRTLLQKQ